MTVLDRIERSSAGQVSAWWFGEVPARRLRLVTAATFGYAVAWLVIRAPYVWDVSSLPARRFEPVGVLAWMDAPPNRGVVAVMWTIALVASALATANVHPRVMLPAGSIGVLLIITLVSSYGQVFHTEHLLVLDVLILAAGVLIEPPRRAVVSGWPLRLMMTVVVTAYVVAGVSKLRLGGTDWLTGDVLRGHVAADNLRKLLLDDLHSPLGGWLAGIAWIWPVMAGLTIVVELGSPFALLETRFRWIWLGLAWGFHVGVLALMAISFPYQLTGVAFAAFIPLEKIRIRRLRQSR